MTSQATQILPFTKFARGGFGFSSKSRNTTKTVENDEDWYIPYNGPYEAPRERPNRRKARDSWGDPVEPDDEEDTVLNDRELHLRYGDHGDLTDRNNSGRHLEEDRKGRSRDRTFSATSGHTVSSGTIDPNRPNTGINRRSTVSAGTRPALPSYISLDAVGGVGESPIPHHRSSKEGNRISLAGIFNFGAQPRKPFTPAASSAEHVVSGHFIRKPALLQRSNMRTGYDNERVYSKIDSPARNSSSPEHHPNPPVKDKHQQLHHQVMLQADRVSSDTTEDDYHNSYYSNLVHEQRSELVFNRRHRYSPSLSEDLHHSQQPPFDQSNHNRQNSSSTSSGHPYALAIPRTNIEGFSTAPSIPPSNPPRLTFVSPSHNPSSVDAPNFSFPRTASPRARKLINSNSTPDMRNSVVPHDPIVTTVVPSTNSTPQQVGTPHFVFPKAKDRWLSAETWCDALLFPRPRLRIGNVSTLGGGSGRIVSPPGSPLAPDFIGSTGTRELGVASRVLAHSRSLVDLNRPVGLSSNYAYAHTSTSVSHRQDPQTSRAGAQSRPRSFAQDDLALLSPVPSLAYVLEQGQQLTNERKAWQLQAKGSFGNKRTRTLSNTRSKSLTQNGRRRGHQAQSSIEYLAAQACLGNQNLTPNLAAAELNMTFRDTTTLSKLSKSHSRGDSWSKSAVKIAKSTVAVCGSMPEDEVTVLKEKERDARAASLEGALKKDKTKFIRLADPAYIPVDRRPPINTSPDNSTRLTPSPSDHSDQGVGIALGTPTLRIDQSDPFYLPSHPYAQGGLSFSVPGPASNQMRIDRGTEFAGPHPSINSGIDIPPQISDTIARHKLPPHLLLHPYAQGSARDSYFEQNGLLAEYRSNDGTPQQMKMWAQLSPGVLREVLPGDFQYSPFMPEKDNISPASTTSSDPVYINDTIGVGETLVNATRFCSSQDSGIGTNDSGAHVMTPKPISQVDWDKQPPNVLSEFELGTIRKPTEHNLAPSEDSEALQKPSLTNQAVFTSPEQLLIPVPDRANSTSPAVTSTSSSPHLIPRHLGSPNDLEGFQDLFYRPNNNLRQIPHETMFPDTPSPPNFSTTVWDRNTQRRGTESGLTSLARELIQEFELMALDRERPRSQFSSILSLHQHRSGSISRQPTDDSLQFVFEEASPEPLPEADRPVIHTFQPSGSLPEDVESSRASSLIERIDAEDDDDTAMLRLGVVESVLTPASVPPGHRPNSYTGETNCITNNDEHRPQGQPESSPTSGLSGEFGARTFSSLEPPSSAIRSSVMSTSTASRMSNLSDFPSPPKDNYMSLGTYLNESLSQTDLRSDVPPPPSRVQEQQVFFGRNQDAGDLVKALSSSS